MNSAISVYLRTIQSSEDALHGVPVVEKDVRGKSIYSLKSCRVGENLLHRL
jgi:hypothetical protein